MSPFEIISVTLVLIGAITTFMVHFARTLERMTRLQQDVLKYDQQAGNTMIRLDRLERWIKKRGRQIKRNSKR